MKTIILFLRRLFQLPKPEAQPRPPAKTPPAPPVRVLEEPFDCYKDELSRLTTEPRLSNLKAM